MVLVAGASAVATVAKPEGGEQHYPSVQAFEEAVASAAECAAARAAASAASAGGADAALASALAAALVAGCDLLPTASCWSPKARSAAGRCPFPTSGSAERFPPLASSAASSTGEEEEAGPALRALSTLGVRRRRASDDASPPVLSAARRARPGRRPGGGGGGSRSGSYRVAPEAVCSFGSKTIRRVSADCPLLPVVLIDADVLLNLIGQVRTNNHHMPRK